MVGPSLLGPGLCPEAAAAVVEHAFAELGVDEIECGHFADNSRSARVIARLGFQPDGRKPIYSVARGAQVECAMFRLTRAGYEATER
ncbi:MAG: GNAT family protein [Hyphomicrobiaceae bacterium]